MDEYVKSVKYTLSRYADFSGYSARSEYWYIFVFNILTAFLVSQIDIYLLPRSIAFLAPLVSLILIVPGIAVPVRRLHDIGRSGWFLLVGFVPLVGFLLLLYWFTQPSKEQDNPFRTAVA